MDVEVGGEMVGGGAGLLSDLPSTLHRQCQAGAWKREGVLCGGGRAEVSEHKCL